MKLKNFETRNYVGLELSSFYLSVDMKTCYEFGCK